jgi:hypothetical protein
MTSPPISDTSVIFLWDQYNELVEKHGIERVAVAYPIAFVCHEANRAYCITLADFSQAPWEKAPYWQRASAILGVLFHLDNPGAGPEASHKAWYDQKQVEGWAFGPEKDLSRKLHPCMIPFRHLAPDQQRKDVIFRAIVHAYIEEEVEV